MKYFHLTEKLQIGVRIFYVNPEKKNSAPNEKRNQTNARYFCQKNQLLNIFKKKKYYY